MEATTGFDNTLKVQELEIERLEVFSEIERQIIERILEQNGLLLDYIMEAHCDGPLPLIRGEDET